MHYGSFVSRDGLTCSNAMNFCVYLHHHHLQILVKCWKTERGDSDTHQGKSQLKKIFKVILKYYDYLFIYGFEKHRLLAVFSKERMLSHAMYSFPNIFVIFLALKKINSNEY